MSFVVGRRLPAGYSIQQRPGLVVPYYLTNRTEFRDVLTREALFSFPLAGLGFFVAGPLGVLVGHVLGASAGWVRYRRIVGT